MFLPLTFFLSHPSLPPALFLGDRLPVAGGIYFFVAHLTHFPYFSVYLVSLGARWNEHFSNGRLEESILGDMSLNNELVLVGFSSDDPSAEAKKGWVNLACVCVCVVWLREYKRERKKRSEHCVLFPLGITCVCSMLCIRGHNQNGPIDVWQLFL